MIDIKCNYCDTPAKINGQFIYMKCNCCDDRRIIPLQDHVNWNMHNDYLYSMISDDFIHNLNET